MPDGASLGAPPPPPNAPPLAWTPISPPSRRFDPMTMAAFWGRAIGFVLLFLGTLIAVAFATPGGGCFTAPPACGGGSTFITGAANAILAAKILWAIGLFFLGAGAGLKLHWGSPRPTGASSDEYRFVIHDRRLNAILLFASIVLLWLLLAPTGTFVAVPP